MSLEPRGLFSILVVFSVAFVVACSSKRDMDIDPASPDDASTDGVPDAPSDTGPRPRPDAPPIECTPLACTTGCGTGGEQACLPNGAHAACIAEEVCNGCDDDGDEDPDDELFCALGERRTCMTGCGNPGVEECLDDCSAFGGCVVNTETCDGTDSDEDGVADHVPDPLTVEHACLTSAGYELTGFNAACSETPELNILGVYEGERPDDDCEPSASCTCSGAACNVWDCGSNACSAVADSSGGVSFTCSSETCRLDFEGSGGTVADCTGSENCWVRHDGSGSCTVACGEHCTVQGSTCTVTCADGSAPVNGSLGTICGGGVASEPPPPSLRQVRVTVNRTGVPMILWLHAYSDTNWELDIKDGVELERVITDGYGTATVTGLDSGIPHEDANIAVCAYAWPASDGCRTECLVEGAEQLTGRNVTSFHGCYHSTSFAIQ